MKIHTVAKALNIKNNISNRTNADPKAYVRSCLDYNITAIIPAHGITIEEGTINPQKIEKHLESIYLSLEIQNRKFNSDDKRLCELFLKRKLLIDEINLIIAAFIMLNDNLYNNPTTFQDDRQLLYSKLALIIFGQEFELLSEHNKKQIKKLECNFYIVFGNEVALQRAVEIEPNINGKIIGDRRKKAQYLASKIDFLIRTANALGLRGSDALKKDLCPIIQEAKDHNLLGLVQAFLPNKSSNVDKLTNNTNKYCDKPEEAEKILKEYAPEYFFVDEEIKQRCTDFSNNNDGVFDSNQGEVQELQRTRAASDYESLRKKELGEIYRTGKCKVQYLDAPKGHYKKIVGKPLDITIDDLCIKPTEENILNLCPELLGNQEKQIQAQENGVQPDISVGKYIFEKVGNSVRVVYEGTERVFPVLHGFTYLAYLTKQYVKQEGKDASCDELSSLIHKQPPEDECAGSDGDYIEEDDAFCGELPSPTRNPSPKSWQSNGHRAGYELSGADYMTTKKTKAAVTKKLEEIEEDIKVAEEDVATGRKEDARRTLKKLEDEKQKCENYLKQTTTKNGDLRQFNTQRGNRCKSIQRRIRTALLRIENDLPSYYAHLKGEGKQKKGALTTGNVCKYHPTNQVNWHITGWDF